ncbi:MAG: PHP domain-containing protein, partial [Firmicutes bacterium]|nr:PHP domain-containing protein [Bacillota bacterium]
MIRSDFHSHSNFSDGIADPREMVEAAIAKGLTRYGLSDHGYAPYDLDVCIPLERRPDYIPAIRALQEEYAGRIDLKLGLEMDALSEEEEIGYDYKIGSVHYAQDSQGHLIVIDYPADCLQAGAETAFGGDVYALLESYWSIAGEVVERTDCDIIGHFDLCAKYSEREDCPFDPQHPRYVAAWQKAADRLLKTGRLFEINMGAV